MCVISAEALIGAMTVECDGDVHKAASKILDKLISTRHYMQQCNA